MLTLSISVSDSLLVGIFGIAIVFVILFCLSLLLRLQSALVARFTKKKPATAEVCEVAAVPVQAPVLVTVSAPAAEPVSAPSPSPAAAADNTPDEIIVKAPAPGVVTELMVTAGEKIRRGRTLLLLEVMKMENDITAPREGIVAQVMVSKGASVVTGTPLVKIQ